MTTNRDIMDFFDSWMDDIAAHNALSRRDEIENMRIADKTVEAERLAVKSSEENDVIDISVTDGGFSHKMSEHSVGKQIQQLRMRDINNERPARENPDSYINGRVNYRVPYQRAGRERDSRSR